MKKYLTKLFYSQKGAYTIMTALMMPAILLFMGLGIGVLALLNDKAELGDASEAAAFAMAKENKGNDTSVNAAITQSVYQFYFPHLTNIGSNTGSPHQFQVGFHRVGGGTPPSPHIEKHPSQHYSCQVTPSYTSGAANYYRASGRDFEFNSLAGHLLGSLGFESLEKVVNTGLAKNGGAVVPGSRTCACDAGYTGTPPSCTLAHNPGFNSVSISFVIDSSQSVTEKVFPYEVEMVKRLAQKVKQLHASTGGRANFQVVQFARYFSINNIGYSAFFTNIEKVANGNNYLNPAIFKNPISVPIDQKSTQMLNILDEANYDEFVKELSNIKYTAGLSGIAAPYLYSVQSLYKLKTHKHETLHNISVLITDGYPSPSGTWDNTSASHPRVPRATNFQIDVLDQLGMCNYIKQRFKNDSLEFTPILFLIPGLNGSSDFPKKDFMQNCFPTDNVDRYYNETLDSTKVDAFVEKLYDDIKKTIEAPAHLSGSKSAHITAGKLSHSAFAVSTSSPQLIYRWSQSEVPLPN